MIAFLPFIAKGQNAQTFVTAGKVVTELTDTTYIFVDKVGLGVDSTHVILAKPLFDAKLNITDTSTMLDYFVERGDTAVMLDYINTDIALKVNITDTSTMLDYFVERGDTAVMLDYINTDILGKQDNPVNYPPTTIVFGNATQEYDIDGITWVSSSDGTPNAASHLLPAALAAIDTAYDSQYLAVREVTGVASATNPLTITFTFPTVATFNVVKFRTKYVGSASHEMVFELYNGSTWDMFVNFPSELYN